MSEGGMEDRTLLLDMLRPFRKALRRQSGRPSPSSLSSVPSQASARLRFDDTAEPADDDDDDDADRTPLKRPRTGSESAPSPSPSPWQVNRYRGEVLESRARIDRLEKQLGHQHVVRKEMEELFQNERQMFVAERKSREAAVADLDERVAKGKAREADLRRRLAAARREADERDHAAEKERQATRRQIDDLRGELTEANADAERRLLAQRAEAAELSRRLEAGERELRDYRALYEESSAAAAELARARDALESRNAALERAESRLRELENAKRDLEEIEVLQRRLTGVPRLEREAARLRDENAELRAAARRNLLLEEQVQFYKTRTDTMDPLYQNYCDLQKKFIEAEKTLDEWKRIGEAHDAAEPDALLVRIEALQRRELALLSEKKDAESSLLSVKSELTNINHEHKKSSSKLSDLQNIQKTQESFIHRLQKKLLLVSRERDSYRQQLDCYEKDLTVNIGSETSQGSSVLKNRVESLEKSVKGYQDLLSKMEEEMGNAKGTPARQEQLSRLKDEVMNLTKENEILRTHLDKVEGLLEKSVSNRDNQATTKVLHLTANPLSKAQDNAKHELERANAEIQHLKYRIKKLEANELEMTQKLSETLQLNGPSSEEYNQLKEQLESHKIKLQRMKEVYTTSSQEYKDVCYMLMGYKMDRTGINNYRLTSMYADSPDQCLSFKLLSSGGIEMMPTDYSSTLGDLVDEHLQQTRSFPVFLSELTLDLFKKTTIMESMTE